jgi:hypothetical protein
MGDERQIQDDVQNCIKLGLPPKFHSFLMYHIHPNYATKNYSRWLDLERCFEKDLTTGLAIQKETGSGNPTVSCDHSQSPPLSFINHGTLADLFQPTSVSYLLLS